MKVTTENIAKTRSLIAPHVFETPVWPWRTELARDLFGASTDAILKLELFNISGSFKIRGVMSVLLNADKAALSYGVTALSAGNHAIALAYASRLLGLHAKVVMPRSANKSRVARCKALGAEVIFTETVADALDRVLEIEKDEGRFFVHPFEGEYTALGTATLGDEFIRQVPDLDAVIIAIGGGGLCAGASAAIRLAKPSCRVYGVEPFGADNMYRSLREGSPQRNASIESIADSLGPPASEPISFGYCRDNLEKIVRVEDHELISAMNVIFDDLKMAVEPAAAAGVAALAGPLREELQGHRVGIIVCGTNIDLETFNKHVSRLHQ